jgi:RNA polymerase sigma factor (sigma-70 family)
MNHKELSDNELLLMLKNKSNNDAFITLYNRYWSMVLNFAYQKTNDLMIAEDITQDIFVSLWKRREELEITNNFKNYLMVSIKYRVIKVLDKKRKLNLEKDLSIIPILDNSTQEWLEFTELKKRLEALVIDLPEKYEIVYRLNKEKGFSHKQISKTLQISEQAVNSRLVRARKMLTLGLRNYMSIFF